MKYWVIKGNPRWYRWDVDLDPGHIEKWGSRSLPADLAVDDRLFLWESGGKRRIIGFGEVVRIQPGRDSDGRRLFDVRYLTSRLQAMPGIEELRTVPLLHSAQFLQPGPFATVYSLSAEQARTLYRIVVEQNHQEHIWRDLGGAKTPIPPSDIEVEAWEGNPKMVTHLRRERAPVLAKKKKEQFRRKHGRLFCEACRSEHPIYSKLLESAFEVHHCRPLGTLKKAAKTSLSDLGILCATCHRVIHRTVPMLSIPAFKRLIEASAIGASSRSKPKPS
jgi:hypothetical protein